MQLSSRTLALCCALAWSGSARADSRADVGVSYFGETASSQPLNVARPHVDFDIEAHRVVSVRFGYDADIVSGATPRTYGASADAISSATQFSDVRHAVHGGLELRMGPTALDIGYTYGHENDYRSHSIDVGAKVNLWGKNTTFKLAYSHNFDSVCDADNGGATPLERRALATSQGCFENTTGLTTEPLSIDTYAASWTQVITPILLSDVGATFQVLNGFQSNPYRRVRLFGGAVEAQESMPLLRQRLGVQARLRIAIKKAKAAIGVGGRYYWDTWGIHAGNVELSYEQFIIPQVLIRLRGRFYQQGRAVFYRDAGEPRTYDTDGPVGQYFTGDREMSPFRNYLIGGRIAYIKNANEKGKLGRVFEALELAGKVDVWGYEALTPLPPNLPRSTQLIDAILAQVELTLRF